MTTTDCAKISVLMPVFKPNPVWLRATISSLNLQSYGKWQLVLSLDGSDTATLAAAQVAQETLTPGHPLIVVEGQRSGISATLNRGLAACNTPYTARLDADDLCRPDRLEQQWQLLENNPDLVACGMQIQAIDREGNRITTRMHVYPTSPAKTLLVGAILNTPIAHPVLMFRTHEALSLGGYRPQRCMEDYELMARLCTRGGLTNLPSIGLDYRVHDTQHSRQARPERRQLLEARWTFLKALSRHQPASMLLAGVPLLLYGLGPQGEYRLRKFGHRLWRRASAMAANPERRARKEA